MYDLCLICTSCTLGVQENGAIGLVVLKSAEILGLIVFLAIHFLCVSIEYYKATFFEVVCYTCTLHSLLAQTVYTLPSAQNTMFSCFCHSTACKPYCL